MSLTAESIWNRALHKLRGWLLPPMDMDASTQNLTTEEAQSLREIATSESLNVFFLPRLEALFQRQVRLNNRMPRVVLALLTCLTFVSAPLWVSLILKLPPDLHWTLLAMEVGFLAPLFALVTWAQARHPMAAASEHLFLFAFIAEVVCTEYFRYVGESLGESTEPITSVVVPVAVLTLARLPALSCLVFVAAYFGIVITGSVGWPHELGTRLPTSWLLEVLIMLLVLLSAAWSRLSFRRQWASSVLTEVMAYRDPLTGLANRRAFEDHYHRVLVEAERSHTHDLIVALVDLDHFKKLNDIYGHEYGDSALIQVGLALSKFAQGPLDTAARLGGEEFALLLYGCDVATARARLPQLLQQMRDLAITHMGGGDRGVLTCSIGAAAVRLDLPLSESYREADEMLYQVKHGGRDNYALAQV